MPFGCSLNGELQEYYMGEGGGFPRVWAVVSQVSPSCPWLVPNTKGVPECELTNLWLVLDAGLCNKIIVPLPSLIPEPQHAPSTPFSVESWERAPSSKQFRCLAFLEPS